MTSKFIKNHPSRELASLKYDGLSRVTSHELCVLILFDGREIPIYFFVQQTFAGHECQILAGNS